MCMPHFPELCMSAAHCILRKRRERTDDELTQARMNMSSRMLRTNIVLTGPAW